MTPLERAENARRLLDDPVFQAAMSDIRMWLVSQLEATAFGDAESHHDFAITLQLLARIRTQIARYADELEIDKHKRRDDNWIARMRETWA